MAAAGISQGAAAVIGTGVAYAAAAVGVVGLADTAVTALTGESPVKKHVFGGKDAAYGNYQLFSAMCTAGVVHLAAFSPGICFVEGTPISTEEGLRPIEDIQAGDMVWAMDPETGEKGLRRVVQTFVNQAHELIHLKIRGEEIQTTPEHPFYVKGKGWLEAQMLVPGDELVLRGGETVCVGCSWYEALETPITVYNFEVEEFHTYFVGEIGVLVHNVCKGNWVDGGKGSPEKNKQHHYNKHGAEVGATSIENYNNKATGFANNVLGGARKYVDGITPNTYRYGNKVFYVDLALIGEEHKLVSFGRR